MHTFKSSKDLKTISGNDETIKRYRKLYVKLTLLILTNLVYWIPLDVLLILSMCWVDLPVEMSNWFAVFVLPVGAVTDPFIFTMDIVTSIKEKFALIKQSEK